MAIRMQGSGDLVPFIRLVEGAGIRGAVGLFITFSVFGGAIRWGLVSLGLSWATYVPQMLAGLLFTWCLGATLYNQRIGAGGLLLLMVSLYGLWMAMLNETPIVQALFGVYIFWPFILGLVSWPMIHRYSRVGVWTAWSLFAAILAGLALDAVIDLPWEGFEYELAGKGIAATKEWETMGSMPRLSGFSRASYSAADQIGLVLAYLLVTVRSKFLLFGIAGLGLVGLFATTMKSALLAGLGVVIAFLLHRSGLRYWVLGLVGFLAVLAIAAPWIANARPIRLPVDSLEAWLLLASFQERLSDTWPTFVSYVCEKQFGAFGLGFGGVGVAQMYLDPYNYHFPDNLPLYLFGLFGGLGVAAYAALVGFAIRLTRSQTDGDTILLLWFVFAVVSGLTINVPESGELTFALGAIFGRLSCRNVSCFRESRGCVTSGNV